MNNEQYMYTISAVVLLVAGVGLFSLHNEQNTTGLQVLVIPQNDPELQTNLPDMSPSEIQYQNLLSAHITPKCAECAAAARVLEEANRRAITAPYAEMQNAARVQAQAMLAYKQCVCPERKGPTHSGGPARGQTFVSPR